METAEPSQESFTGSKNEKRGSLAARISFWSPFLALFVLALTGPLVDPVKSLAPLMILLSVLLCLGLAGLTLGCVALARLKWRNRKALAAMAGFGTVLNALMLYGGIDAGIDAHHARENRAARLATDLIPRRKPRSPFATLQNLESSMEKISSEKTNKLNLVALAVTNFLAPNLPVISNLFSAARPLESGPLLDMSQIDSRDELAARRALVIHFLEANGDASNLYRNVEREYDTALMQAGLSSSNVVSVSNQFHTQMGQIQAANLWEKNHQWGSCEAQALGLLESNWFEWKYDPALRKIVFHNEEVRTNFNALVHEINLVAKERLAIASELKKLTETKSTNRTSNRSN